MNGSIRLSEKHGVNPALGVCFWCGEEDGTLVLVGRLPNDAEAPRHIVTSYEPCTKCKGAMEKGVVLIEVQQRPLNEGMPEIQQGLWPTGRWCVITLDAVMRIFTPEATAIDIGKHRKAFLDPEAYTKIMGSQI